MTDAERPANPLERFSIESAFPVPDVHTLIDDGPHGSRDLDTLWFETCATPRHESPELFHFDDALDRNRKETSEGGRPIGLPASRPQLSPLDARPTTGNILSAPEQFPNRVLGLSEGL